MLIEIMNFVWYLSSSFMNAISYLIQLLLDENSVGTGG
jgi:hypothetical protein